MIDVSSPLAIRRCIIPFYLGTLITFLTRKPIVPTYLPNPQKCTPDQRSALPTIDIGGRVSPRRASTPPTTRRTTTRATGNNNHGTIYIRGTRNERSGAAILLPSFRSPRLCNYDFIFMDINYTGRLAVSLYGILIQGCRHNGNPRATRSSLLTCP